VNADALIAHQDVAQPQHQRLFLIRSFRVICHPFSPDQTSIRYDRGYRAAPLDVVMIEGKIDVNDDKCDKEPQEKVMPEAHAEFSTHQRHNPNEHPGQPRRAHAGVEREAGDCLEDKHEECAEVNQAGQSVVAGGDRPVHLGFQHVGFDYVDNLLLL